MFFSKPKSYLGVDLGAGGVKIVELKEEKKRPVLYTYGLTSGMQDIHGIFSFSRPGSNLLGEDKNVKNDLNVDLSAVKRYADIIKAITVSAKTSSKTAVVSLPVSVVFHAVINLPPLKKEEFDRVLYAEVKKLLPRPIDEMVLDYQVMKSESNSRTERVLVNAVPKELISFYTQVFRLAGMELESLEPESVALERALIGRDQSVAMIIDIGAERTNFYIIDQGFAVTHHSIEVGGYRINKILASTLGVRDDLVEQLKHDYFSSLLTKKNNFKMDREKFLSLIFPVFDPILKEVGYSFDLYLKQSGNENKHPEKIILTGGGSMAPFLADYITDKFNIKSYIGDPWGRVVYQDGLRPALAKIGPRMSVSIGLALRNMM